jgi:type I restriction enzyme S subunit
MTSESSLGWSHRTLGSLADYINGFGFGPDQWGTSGLPIVRIENMRDPEAPANLYSGTLPDRFKVAAGDLLLSWSATLMALIWDRPPAWVNQHIFKVVPGPSVDSAYLCHLLNAALDRLAAKSHGTTMKHVKRSDLLPFEVLVAPTTEQPEIGRILDTVDDAIRSTEHLIAKLEQVEQGLLHDLLTRGIDESGQLRDVRRQPRLFTNTDLGLLPRHWEVTTLDRAIEIIDCKHYTPTYVEEGIPVVRPRNIKSYGISFADVEFVSDADFRILTEKHTPRRGDIVFCRNASFGTASFVDFDAPFAIGQDTIILTPRREDSRFIHACMEAEGVQRQIQALSGGSTFGRINLREIRKLLLPVPPIEEQTSIVAVLATEEQRLRTEHSYLAVLQMLKAGLRDDLLTGRVRVTQEAA